MKSVQLTDQVTLNKLENDYVLMQPYTGYFYRVNSTSAYILQALKEQRTETEACAWLASHYNVSEDRIMQDWAPVRDYLIDRKVLCVV